MKKFIVFLVIFSSISFFSFSSVISKENFNNLLNNKIVIFIKWDCYINMTFWNSLDVSQKKKFCKNVSDTCKYYKGLDIYTFYSMKDESIISKRSSNDGDYKILK